MRLRTAHKNAKSRRVREAFEAEAEYFKEWSRHCEVSWMPKQPPISMYDLLFGTAPDSVKAEWAALQLGNALYDPADYCL